MLEPALAAARSWTSQVRALAPAPGRPLTHDETVFLFRVQDRLTRWLAGLRALPIPAEGAEADRLRAGVSYLEVLRMTVRTTLVRANLGLVQSEASGAWVRARAARRRRTSMSLEDMVQEGQIGLMTAIDRFEWRRGLRFSTYATVIVRRQIDRAIVEKEPLVYLPVHALQSLRVVRDFSVRYRTVHGRAPSPQETARATGVSLDTIAAIQAVGRQVAEREDDESGGALWAVPDSNAVDALRALVSGEVERIVDAAVSSLDPLEREVIQRRFGLAGQPELSQAEVGRLIGYSQQRVGQIESRALLKLLVAAQRQGAAAPADTPW